ncbi:SDR family oxidoreductase [Bryobacter aggregatus]|uniref:SDR family oxidoreductase n=1 Tax=Bryobacter aggregatus TaxID=360054 RepID=UPI000AE2E064|nr:SDR family NAD(P)-dependent oxidoreductase [Bryobacter aggregatus]
MIVGASSGIGRSTALLFARDGAKVYASARREDRLAAMAAELAGEGHPIHFGTSDAGSHESMEKLAADATQALGGIDIVIYATGTNTPDRAMTRLNRTIWNELIEVNLNGAFSLTAALLPAMRMAGKGHFIYVSSISGKLADVSGAAYQASKRGMLGLAAAIRQEEREHGIRTCVVCPGLVDTELMEKRPVKPTAETLGKALQPEDVAELIYGIARLHPRVAVPEVEILPTVL